MLSKPIRTIPWGEDSTVKVYGNNHPRPLFYGYELTTKERADFTWYDENELEDKLFFRYKGQVYALDDFTACANPHWGSPTWARAGFDGYRDDSYFSGVLIKYCEDDDDSILAYTFIC